MTEEEAKAKWCPQVRYVGSHGRDAVTQGHDRCIGSACMAWRTDRPEDWSAEMWTPTGHGYCGLGGKP